MTAGSDISRRSVLRLLGWWVGLGASPLRSLAAVGEPAGGRGDAFDSALRLLPHRASAVAIGRQFLREHPAEADAERLLGLLGLPSLASAPSPSEIENHRDRLREIHRQDFRSGRVVELSGWTLSITELRLAALVALAADAGG